MYINILTVYSLYTTGFGKVVSFWDGFDMVRFFGAQDLDTIEILQWWICSAGSSHFAPISVLLAIVIVLLLSFFQGWVVKLPGWIHPTSLRKSDQKRVLFLNVFVRWVNKNNIMTFAIWKSRPASQKSQSLWLNTKFPYQTRLQWSARNYHSTFSIQHINSSKSHWSNIIIYLHPLP